MAEPLPHPWVEYRTADNDPYYHNTSTNVTQWQRPAAATGCASARLPGGSVAGPAPREQKRQIPEIRSWGRPMDELFYTQTNP